MFAAKTDEKTAWRIVSDPIAEERQWMAACTVVGEKQAPQTRESITEKIPDKLHALLTASLGFMTSLGLVFFAFTAVNETGTFLGISDKLTTWSDWYSAVMLMVCIPAATSMFTGFIQRQKEQGPAWVLSWLPLFGLGTLGSTDTGLLVLPLALAGIVMAHVGYSIGRELKAFWHAHQGVKHPMIPMIGLVTGMSGVMWFALLTNWTGHANTPHIQSTQEAAQVSMVMIASFSFLFGSLTSAVTTSKLLATRIGAALTMQAPMLMFYAITLVAGLIYAACSAVTGNFDASVLTVGAVVPIVAVAPSIAGSAMVWKATQLFGKH